MRKGRKWLWVAGLAIVFIAIALNRSEPESDGSPAAEIETSTDTLPESPAPDDVVDEPGAAARGTTVVETPAGESAATASAMPDTVYILADDIRIGDWLDSFQESVRNSSAGDFELKRQKAEEDDGEAAYWLSEFYKYCDDAPRSDWQLDQALSRTEQWVTRATRDGNRRRDGDRRLYRLENSLNFYEQGYELCSFLGPDFDTKAESLAWLERSADLGYMPALRLYHSQARQLLTEDDATLGFQHPELISTFKANAKRYAQQLLAADHPQGYLLMARMYYVGDVYEQDYLTAYAYARAGYLVGTAGSQSDAVMWMRIIGSNLPPDVIPDAEKMASEFLNRK